MGCGVWVCGAWCVIVLVMAHVFKSVKSVGVKKSVKSKRVEKSPWAFLVLSFKFLV